MAHMIQEELQCDIFEVLPTNPYPDDLSEVSKRHDKEKSEKASVAIKNKINNIGEYDTIFFGYPVWNADMPMIMYTFIETYEKELENKTIIPFCTHEGMDQIKTFIHLKKILNKSKVQRGFDLYGKYVDTSKEKVHQWLSNLHYY
ncbi:hypothetical protein PIROE2DRAFT_14782 [Piromyces sp. E2]|nr:hypothetical protein PIROE2DRAFT_14782 [Piromyces sp. E2]|eukprot:OUM59635.1 hypothetical protein PIROE2DRAFT_14782 [Piromyces sp. E2]